MAVLLFGVSLSAVMAQELPVTPEKEAVSLVDSSHPAVQAYLAREKAFQNKDYNKAWEVTSESVKRDRFKDSIVAFEENYSRNPDKLTDRYITIKQAVLTNPKEVRIEIESGQTFVMREENDNWYWVGTIQDIEGK